MVVIVDYGLGNLASIVNMGRKAGEALVVSGDPVMISTADKLILPGVGAFDNGVTNLHKRDLVAVLSRRVLEQKVPILGLCLGLQLFTRGSEEGTLPGFGWIAAETRRFDFNGLPHQLKVPHMGWNGIEVSKPAPLLNGLGVDARFYFVHSFYLACDDPADVLTWTTYGHSFASAIQRGNIYGTQFHPEKSHRFGLTLLRNFLALS